MSAEKEVEKFIRQQLFRNREIPLASFSLRHAAPGAKGQEVETFEISGSLSTDDVPVLRDEVLARAQSDADGLGAKTQRYILMALEAGAKNGPRCTFRLKGEGDEDEADGEDSPDNRGLLQQLMRHNEALTRTFMMGMGSTVQHLQRQLQSANDHNENLLSQRREDFKVIEEAKNQQHEREMQLLLVSGQEDRKNEWLKKLEPLFPILLNKLSGKAVLTTEEKSVIAGFADSLSPAQLATISQTLTTEQQISLVTIIKAAKEKEAASQKQGNGTPS